MPRHHRVPTHDGLHLHVVEYASLSQSRRTLICIPGMTRTARDFEAVAPRLAGRDRVLCVELRGRGGSDFARDPMEYVPQTYLDDLACVFDHFDLPAAVLVGTSLGALVSTLFAALAPHRTLGVVLNDAGPEIDPRGLARIGGYVGRPAPVTNWDEAAQFVRAQDGIVFPDYSADDWMRLARRRFGEDTAGIPRLDYDMAIAVPFSAPATTPPQWPFFRRLEGIPALVLRGAHSDVLSPATLAAMHEAVAGLRSAEIPQRGHAPSLEEPEAIAAIDDFLATVPDALDPQELQLRKARGDAFAEEAFKLGLRPPEVRNTPKERSVG